MKVALILCPSLYKRLPLNGIAYLSAYLRNRRHAVDVIDCNAEYEWPNNDKENVWQNKRHIDNFTSINRLLFESIVDRIIKTDAPVIGFSVWASTKHISLYIARLIKDRDTKRLIVFGGPECSFTGEELINNDAVDIVVRGEGEVTLAEIVSQMNTYGKVNYCKGAIVKIDGAIVDGGFRPEIEDLDSLSFPDYSDFCLNKYNADHALPISFSRGCLRQCAFCNTATTWKKLRSRTAQNVFAEMVHQLSLFPTTRKFEIDDSALNLNIRLLNDLSDLMISDGMAVNWGGSGLIRKEMNAPLLQKMAQAGFNCIGYGLESGSQKIVDLMGKGFLMDDAERVIRDTFNANIEVIVGIVIGFPGETEEDFMATLHFLEKNKKYLSWVHTPSECSIGGNSYLQRNPERFGVSAESLRLGGAQGWTSLDGTSNTHEERERRMVLFDQFLDAHSISQKHYTTVV